MRININASMRSDLDWFTDFASVWNGVSVFPNPIPTREIVVDACLIGIGSTSTHTAYAYDLTKQGANFANISELEAINVAVPIQTFIGPSDHGSTVSVLCDNMAAVQVFQSGRGKNHVILEAARTAWMVQALYQVNIVFSHIPGYLNSLADALSRAHTSKLARGTADSMVRAAAISWIEPCIHSLNMVLPFLSRSQTPSAHDSGSGETGQGQGPGNKQKQTVSSEGVPQVLLPVSVATADTSTLSDVHLYRASQHQKVSSIDNQEPHRAYKILHEAGRRTPSGRPLQDLSCHRGDNAQKGLRKEGEAISPNHCHNASTGSHSKN